MRMRFMIAGIAIAMAGGCGDSDAPTTRGGVADREAAHDVARCARQYLRRPGGDQPSEIWLMCLHTASELARRNKINVARHVIRNEGANVFEPVNPKGDLSAAMIARINSGK